MHRLYQWILIASTVVGSWLGMQAVHESGHVVGGGLTGGRAARVVLNPLTISRTDLAENPHPLAVVWAGPIIGAVVPLLLWRAAATARWSGAFLLRFFAGFCLIANGLYIGVGSFGRVGDCGEMLRHGSPIWTLWLFGLIAAPLGFWLWHGQGRYFGFGLNSPPVSRGAAFGALAVCIALVLVDFVVDGR